MVPIHFVPVVTKPVKPTGPGDETNQRLEHQPVCTRQRTVSPNARQESYSVEYLGYVRGRKPSRSSMFETAGLRVGYAAGCCARLTGVLRVLYVKFASLKRLFRSGRRIDINTVPGTRAELVHKQLARERGLVQGYRGRICLGN